MLCNEAPWISQRKRNGRVYYSPKFERSEYLKDDLQVIRGTPQPIVEIPLKNIPQEGFFGAAIPTISRPDHHWPNRIPFGYVRGLRPGRRRARSYELTPKVWVSESSAPAQPLTRRETATRLPPDCPLGGGIGCRVRQAMLVSRHPARRSFCVSVTEPARAPAASGGRSREQKGRPKPPCPVKPLWPVAAVRSRAREGTRRAARRAGRVPSDPVS